MKITNKSKAAIDIFTRSMIPLTCTPKRYQSTFLFPLDGAHAMEKDNETQILQLDDLFDFSIWLLPDRRYP